MFTFALTKIPNWSTLPEWYRWTLVVAFVYMDLLIAVAVTVKILDMFL